MNNDENNPKKQHAVVIGIQEGLVRIQKIGTGPLIKNEIIYICLQDKTRENEAALRECLGSDMFLLRSRGEESGLLTVD